MIATPNGSVLKYGVGQLRPASEEPRTAYSPLSTYKWADTERALESLAKVAADEFDDVVLEFTNPHTGAPVRSSFTCWVQFLRPGVSTRAHRHTGSSVYLAFEGSGATIIDGIRYPWTQGDMHHSELGGPRARQCQGERTCDSLFRARFPTAEGARQVSCGATRADGGQVVVGEFGE